jgi:hypothetical protein
MVLESGSDYRARERTKREAARVSATGRVEADWPSGLAKVTVLSFEEKPEMSRSAVTGLAGESVDSLKRPCQPTQRMG